MTAAYTPSPIRAQTAFMAALTKLRHEYEANMAALYACQAEYKAAHSLVETVKSFGFGDLDDLYIYVVNDDSSLRLMVVVAQGRVDALLNALKITGVVYTSRLSDSCRHLIFTLPGYPRLEFLTSAESISLQVVKCAD